jgi:hypothetical protein
MEYSMFHQKSNNADINQYDWAQSDRATLLRSLHAGRALQAPLTASSGWGADAAMKDPRSVHAYLAGKGDLRATWWNLYSAVYMAEVPSATLELAMISFHRLHHALTLSRLSFAQSVAKAAADIEEEGVLVAAFNSVRREMKR